MNSLEYRRVPIRPGAGTTGPSREMDIAKHVKRAAWIASAVFLIFHWHLYTLPTHSPYVYCAAISLLLFMATFGYIVLSIRLTYGYSPAAPGHARWRHYAPRATQVMSIAAFVFYCFACISLYGRLGLIIFPGMAVVCFGASCLLSYL